MTATVKKFESTLPRAAQLEQNDGKPSNRTTAASLPTSIAAARTAVTSAVERGLSKTRQLAHDAENIAADSLHTSIDSARAAVTSVVERGLTKTRRLAHDAENALGGLTAKQPPTSRAPHRGGLLTPVQAALCAATAMFVMQAINYAGMNSNLQWVYNYMPTFLHHALQPQAPRAWYNVIDAAKSQIGGMMNNHMWLKALNKPVWAASCNVHRVAWFCVEAATSIAMYRLLTSPRIRAVNNRTKAMTAFFLIVSAVRSGVWGFLVLGMRSLPLGVFHYATYAVAMAIAAVNAAKVDKRAGRALMLANVWVAYTCAQFMAMTFMNRA